MRRAKIMIVPCKSDDGYWYAVGMYGIWDSSEKMDAFYHIPYIEQSRDRDAIITNAERVGRELLSQRHLDGSVEISIADEEGEGHA